MDKKEYIDIHELIEYLDKNPHPYLKTPCKETIRRWARSGKIPSEKRSEEKQGKYLIFKISEIDEWNRNNRIVQIQG